MKAKFRNPSILFFVASLGFLTGSAAARDLYVATTGSDSNSGSASAPLRTIFRASQLAKPGDTVIVRPGTYQGSFKTTASGTTSARIRYVSERRWAAVIVPPATRIDSTAWTNTGSYVDIEGFDVNGTVDPSLAWRNGIYNTGTYTAIRNNHVHHVGEKAPCDSQGGSAINTDYWNYGVRTEISGNLVNHNGYAGCRYIQAIYVSTSADVKNNIVFQNGGAGIHLWHDANHVNVVNNTIFGNGVGIVVGGEDYYHTTGPADYVNVFNNIVMDNNYGIVENGDTGANNRYERNLVYRNKVQWALQTSQHSNDVDADPQFVNYIKTGGGDYRLRSTSPAINRGTSYLAPSIDFDGVTRPQGGAIDIGAYEYVSAVATTTTTTTSTTLPKPIASLSTTALTFSSQTVGSTSAIQLVTIKNVGNAAMTIPSGFAFTGDFGFGGTGTCKVGVSYAPGASCTASVVFTPTAAGTRTGTLTMMTNASPTPMVVKLSGTGVSPVPAPIASVSPASLQFASQTVGTTSALQLVTIKNTGNAAMTIPSAFTMSGDFGFGGSGTCRIGVSYSPGASCTASVVFKPTAAGTRTGALTMTTNASSTSIVVPLSGTGK